MTNGHVLVVGDVMTDIVVLPEGPIVRGSDRRASIRVRPGGSGANQAVWLAQFGTEVVFVARVGADDLEVQAAHFRALGVTPRLVADPLAPSGVLISIVDATGERSFLTDRGANLNLSLADLPAEALDGAGLVLCSGYSFFTPGPRAAVTGLLKQARSRGIATAVDAASVGFLREVGAKAFLDWTAGTSTVFANADEALELTGMADLAQQVQALGRTYERVVIKRGRDGAALGGRDGIALKLPAITGDIVDSTGAGDAFAAAFLAAELRGGSAEACLKTAIEAGASAVAMIGGQPAPPALTRRTP